MSAEKVEQVVAKHRDSGKFIKVGKIKAFALDYGSQNTETVLCLHGVPTSSFLYRKVLASLASKGYRAISIDFPGLGLSDKPAGYEYSFRNFAKFIEEAIDVLKIEKCHLVVHDMGGPVGFAFAAQNREKVQSITILNTWIDVVNFSKPLVMQAFETPVLGEAELSMITHTTWPLMFESVGVKTTGMVPTEEINAYVDLLKYKDNGQAFLKIMRNYDNTENFRDLCYKAVQNVAYPIQIIWSAEDPALTIEKHAQEIKEATGVKTIEPLYSKHLLQEEVWEALSIKIDEFINQ